MTPLVKFELRAKQDLIQCEVCGKAVKGGQGLYGHLLMAHGIRRAKRETLLAEEVERLTAAIAWKEQELTNVKAEFQGKCAAYEAKLNDMEAKLTKDMDADALMKEIEAAMAEDKPAEKGAPLGLLAVIVAGIAYYNSTKKASGDDALGPVQRLGHAEV